MCTNFIEGPSYKHLFCLAFVYKPVSALLNDYGYGRLIAHTLVFPIVTQLRVHHQPRGLEYNALASYLVRHISLGFYWPAYSL